ncbi:type IA DNA topoisomerase [Paenibacillus amylolyticus]|uniref:type IA DNA topoisomerase n=1 Tax=Paenibacillus amylolyticus TaxID=1451 RepID=UPI00339491C2
MELDNIILIIAEKPDMGRKIGEALGGFIKDKGYLRSDKYIITWAFGHLVGLANPDAYDPRYKTWNLTDLPIVPHSFKLIASESSKKQLGLIKELAKECSSIVNCTDAAREGEAIFRYIYEYLNLRQPFKRLWISSLTKEAIREGFRKLKDGKDYDDLYKAARCRGEADWLIGMNGTRAFSTKFGGHNNVISIGRVQTPVLAMIYDRQQQITNFKSETFFTVKATLQQESISYTGTLQTDERMIDINLAQKISETIKGKVGRITHYDVKNNEDKPPLLYDLGLLQSDANKKLNFTAKKTLEIAQQLYEQIEAISYPRTNSNYVAEDNLPIMHDIFDQLKNTKYAMFTTGDKAYVNSTNKNICRPEKIEDHHAIFPTDKIPNDLTVDQEKIYLLIVKRFLAHFHPPAKYKTHKIFTTVDSHIFQTNIRENISPGWRTLYKEEKELIEKDRSLEDTDLRTNFAFNPKELAFCMDSEVKKNLTTPPSHYTEGTLIDGMKRAGRSILDENLKDEMSDIQLGTPATRTDIIENLKSKEYIIVDAKKLKPTAKGCSLIEAVRKMDLHVLASPEMTALWEQRLGLIAKGQASSTAFSELVVKFTQKIVQKVKEDSALENTPKNEFINTLGKCPECKEESIVADKSYYKCKNLCQIRINKIQLGKELTSKNLLDLLNVGKTAAITFKSSKGKGNYKAKLLLEGSENGRLKIEFVQTKK